VHLAGGREASGDRGLEGMEWADIDTALPRKTTSEKIVGLKSILTQGDRMDEELGVIDVNVNRAC